MSTYLRSLGALALAVGLVLLSAGPAPGHDPDFTDEFHLDRCTFTLGSTNSYFPLWPGYQLVLEGEEEDDEEELVEIENVITVLPEVEIVDGVPTRVVEERESEDGELVEVSRNFFNVCRETGDVLYWGEDVDDYEDGEIVGHEGAWRAGVGGARPGILMPGTPLLGARHFQEVAPGVAEDFGEVVSLDEELEVPIGDFEELLYVVEGSGLDPDEESEKWYAHGIGLVKDDELELVEVVPPPCLPDETTHCLQNGRFRVTAEWADYQANEGAAMAVQPTNESGEFWFFGPENTELVVKVLDACDLPGFNTFWIFAGGLTDVEVTLTVVDTETQMEWERFNPLATPFPAITDTSAFATCP